LFDIPPLFKIIQEESKTDWKEMYKVFNMGHRLEMYVKEDIAIKLIEIGKSFNIETKIIGEVKKSDKKELTITSEHGIYKYY